MANFIDTFNRVDGAVGNSWQFRNKHEGVAPIPWAIAGNRAVEDTGRTTLMGRFNPVAVGANHVVRATCVGKNAAEVFFRWSATAGAGNYRWAVVVNGTSGKLVRRQSSGGTEFEHVETTWTRADDMDFVIRVDITSETITAYDTNFTGPEGLAAAIESTMFNNATGVGMGSGSVDIFEIGDIESYTPTELEFSPIKVSVGTDLHVDFDNADGLDDAVQHYASLSTEPYVVLDGIPSKGDMTLVAPTGVTVGEAVFDDSGAPLFAGLVSTGASHRWLPSQLVNGSESWYPNGASSGLRWLLPWGDQKSDPKRVDNYTFVSAAGPIVRPAVSFNGQGYGQLNNYDSLPTGPFSLAMVAVLHGGAGPYYSLFQTDRSTYADGLSAEAMQLQYRHGEIALSAAGPRATYQRKGVASGATIIVVSFNPGLINRGHMMVQDTRRFSKAFNLRRVSTISRALFLGAAMSIRDEFSPETAGNFDVLEIDMWDYALSPAQMRRFINKVAPLYGVSS